MLDTHEYEEIAPIPPEDLDNLEAYLQYNLGEIQSSTEDDVLTLEKARSFAESNKSKLKKPVLSAVSVEDQIQK